MFNHAFNGFDLLVTSATLFYFGLKARKRGGDSRGINRRNRSSRWTAYFGNNSVRSQFGNRTNVLTTRR